MKESENYDGEISANAPEISIIVPIYKVEKYLGKCLDSIINQTFKYWECILVNDGSPDNSGKIANSFKERDSRFKVIHQENGGVSEARNSALKIAKGKYIAFVDPDDKIDPNYLYVLYNLIKKYNTDVAQCGFTKDFRNFCHKKTLVDKEVVLKGEEIPVDLLYGKIFSGYLWNKLFRREVIQSPFPNLKIFEDFMAIISWSQNISSVVTTPKLLYHYRMRRSSLTKGIGILADDDLFRVCSLNLEKIHKRIPKIFDKEKKAAFLYELYLSRAKKIARINSDKDRCWEALMQTRTEIINLPQFDEELLKPRVRKLGKLLLDNPKRFVKKMKFSALMDIHSKFLAKNMYK